MRASAVPVTAWTAVSALGRGSADHAAALRAERSGLSPCPLPLPFATVTGSVPGDLEPLDGSLARFDSRTARLAVLGYDGVRDHVARAIQRWGADRVALVLGTTSGGMPETDEAAVAWHTTGALPSRYDYLGQQPLGAFTEVVRAVSGIRGPRFVVSAACSSGSKVFASARRLIRAGIVDAALVGGVEALVDSTVRGFYALGVLAPTACKPFAKDRPGMNLGEGAAYALLEREGDARVSLLGVGETSDAYHMSSPDPEGRGALAAMRLAVADAGLEPTAVDHVNAHGTGTRHNDLAESKAIAALFGRRVPVASTKGYTGHLLGASGAIEAIFAMECIARGFLPASLGAEPLDPELDIRLLTRSESTRVRVVLSNSFAFGGSNCALVFGGSEAP